MASAHARMTLASEAAVVSHPDRDLKPGHSLIIRCDDAIMYLGGSDVTIDDGFPWPMGQPFGLSDMSDEMFACVASADEGATLYVLWVGV